MSVHTIVFDFGNVLAFFSHRRAAEQLARFAQRPIEIEQLVEFLFFTELEPKLEVGAFSANDLLHLLRERFSLEGTDDELAWAFGDMFTGNEPVLQLIPELQGRYRLALLSNTNDMHYRVFRQQFADVLDQFDELFTSHEVGMRKPDPRLFAHVTKQLGGRPSEFVFVDDLPVNVEAARAHGWRGIVYSSKDSLRQQLSQSGVTFAAG